MREAVNAPRHFPNFPSDRMHGKYYSPQILDLNNVGVAVEISFLSHLEAEF